MQPDVVDARDFRGFRTDSYKKRKDSRIAVSWRKHVIACAFPNAFEAVAADLDGDGDSGVVASGWAQPGQVALFENHGDLRGHCT